MRSPCSLGRMPRFARVFRERALVFEAQKRWKCKECHKQFSAKLGTIFEDSPIPLTKWMLAMWMIAGERHSH